MSSNFTNRLSLARKMAGLSLQDLSDRLGGEYSKQTLSKYESGQSNPNSKALVALAEMLNVSVNFFFTEPDVKVVLRDFEYRKRASVSKKELDAVQEICNELVNRNLTLAEIMQDNRPLDIYKYPLVIENGDMVETAAKEVRAHWNLGNDPIPNVIAMLEDKGFCVVEIASEADFDGLQAFGGKDVAVIGLRKIEDKCRKRFTALHELAHHILAFPAEMPHKDMEKLCHRFAGAVLFPEDQALRTLDKDRFHFYQQELLALKEYWGISMAAIFARAHSLGIISQHVYTKFSIGYKQRGYHANGEPGNFAGTEKALRFDQLLYRGLAEDFITLQQAAQLTGKTVGELRNELDSIA
jgi:Zn-dependent peptidase ImmA (M78 family)/transcriptional regulator with XRE-family HTH domain